MRCSLKGGTVPNCLDAFSYYLTLVLSLHVAKMDAIKVAETKKEKKLRKRKDKKARKLAKKPLGVQNAGITKSSNANSKKSRKKKQSNSYWGGPVFRIHSRHPAWYRRVT